MILFYIATFAYISCSLLSRVNAPFSELFHVTSYVFLILLFTVSAGYIIGKKRLLVVKCGNEYVIGAYSLWMIMLLPSLVNSSTPIASLAVMLGLFVFGLTIFLLVPSVVQGQKQLFYWNCVWLTCIALTFAVGLFMVARGVSVGMYDNFGRLRYTFGFNNPNTVGLSSFIGSLACIKLTLLSRRKRWLLWLPVFSTILWLSDSRAPMIALFVWIGCYVLLSRPIKYRKVILAVTLACAFFAIMISPSFLARYDELFLSVNKITSGRLHNWHVILGSIEGSEWLIGKGLGTTRAHVMELGLTYENSYLLWLSQAGVVGLLGVLSMVLATFYRLGTVKETPFRAFATATLFAWLVYSAAENILFAVGSYGSFFVWSDIIMTPTGARSNEK